MVLEMIKWTNECKLRQHYYDKKFQ